MNLPGGFGELKQTMRMLMRMTTTVIVAMMQAYLTVVGIGRKHSIFVNRGVIRRRGTIEENQFG